MDGYEKFEKRLLNLELEIQNKVISNIFNKTILLFLMFKSNNRVYFKLYDGYTYFQYCFCFECNVNYIEISIKERIVVCNIYIFDDKIFDILDDNLNKFIKLLIDNKFIYFDDFL